MAFWKLNESPDTIPSPLSLEQKTSTTDDVQADELSIYACIHSVEPANASHR